MPRSSRSCRHSAAPRSLNRPAHTWCSGPRRTTPAATSLLPEQFGFVWTQPPSALYGAQLSLLLSQTLKPQRTRRTTKEFIFCVSFVILRVLCGCCRQPSYPCGREGCASLVSEPRWLPSETCARLRPCRAFQGAHQIQARYIRGSGWQNRACPASVRTPRRRQRRF